MDYGILDLGFDLQSTALVAPYSERLGYRRYWIAEHQPQPNPCLAAALVARSTAILRVGTAGALVSHRNVYELAQDFRFLAAMFPGRIEAGFCAGRIPSSITRAWSENTDPDPAERYYERASTLVGLLRDDLPADHRLHGIAQWSRGTSNAVPISLGTGRRSAVLAAKLGLPYGFSLFHGEVDPSPVSEYRELFRPQEASAPQVILALSCACLTEPIGAEMLMTQTNANLRANVVGAPETCAARISEMALRFRADAVVLVDLFVDVERKKRSFELLAAALEVKRPDARE